MNAPSTRWQPAKLTYTHDAMIDVILAKPTVTAGELAALFERTPCWVGLVRSSDAFRERLEARRAEIVDPTVRATIEERFRAVTARSLEVLAEKLEKPSHQIPDGLVLKAVELGGKALAVGGNAPPPPPREGHLDRLAERLLSLQRTVRGNLYEGEALEVLPTPLPTGAETAG